MGNWLTGADTGDYENAAGQLHDPNSSAYNIPGLSGYQDFYNSAQNGGLNVSPDMAHQNSDYARQGQTADMLYQQAMGNGPSVADQQMKQGLAQADQQIQSSALSHQAGLAPGLTQRNILNAQSGLDSSVIGQGGLQRATEQLGALNGLGNLTSTMRAGSQNQTGQNLGAAEFNVGTRTGAADRGATLAVKQGDNNIALDKAKTSAGKDAYNATLGTAGAGHTAVTNGIDTVSDLATKGAGIFAGLA